MPVLNKNTNLDHTNDFRPLIHTFVSMALMVSAVACFTLVMFGIKDVSLVIVRT